MYDVIIIGHGPAGLSAAIFTSRAQLKTLVIGSHEQSQILYAKNIRNYLGFPEGIDGEELIQKGFEQAKNNGAEIIESEVVNCKKIKNFFSVKTADDKKIKAKALIIATGIPIQWTGIKNEKELLGRGVHTCVSCDGLMYKNKKVAIIGNGNLAAQDTLEMTIYTKNITIISHSAKFEFSRMFMAQLKKRRIKLKIDRIDEFVGDKFLKKIVFNDGREEAYDGAILACGVASSLFFASKLGVEIKESRLVVDENSMTRVSGIFAAGNCIGRCRQIAKNVGDGCNAGISVIRYLKAKDVYFDYAKG